MGNSRQFEQSTVESFAAFAVLPLRFRVSLSLSHSLMKGEGPLRHCLELASSNKPSKRIVTLRIARRHQSCHPNISQLEGPDNLQALLHRHYQISSPPSLPPSPPFDLAKEQENPFVEVSSTKSLARPTSATLAQRRPACSTSTTCSLIHGDSVPWYLATKAHAPSRRRNPATLPIESMAWWKQAIKGA